MKIKIQLSRLMHIVSMYSYNVLNNLSFQNLLTLPNCRHYPYTDKAYPSLGYHMTRKQITLSVQYPQGTKLITHFYSLGMREWESVKIWRRPIQAFPFRKQHGNSLTFMHILVGEKRLSLITSVVLFEYQMIQKGFVLF